MLAVPMALRREAAMVIARVPLLHGSGVIISLSRSCGTLVRAVGKSTGTSDALPKDGEGGECEGTCASCPSVEGREMLCVAVAPSCVAGGCGALCCRGVAPCAEGGIGAGVRGVSGRDGVREVPARRCGARRRGLAVSFSCNRSGSKPRSRRLVVCMQLPRRPPHVDVEADRCEDAPTVRDGAVARHDCEPRDAERFHLRRCALRLRSASTASETPIGEQGHRDLAVLRVGDDLVAVGAVGASDRGERLLRFVGGGGRVAGQMDRMARGERRTPDGVFILVDAGVEHERLDRDGDGVARNMGGGNSAHDAGLAAEGIRGGTMGYGAVRGTSILRLASLGPTVLCGQGCACVRGARVVP